LDVVKPDDISGSGERSTKETQKRPPVVVTGGLGVGWENRQQGSGGYALVRLRLMVFAARGTLFRVLRAPD